MSRPVLMVDLWLKEAQEIRPAGPSDIRRQKAGLNQRYAQPNPPAATTQPSTVSSQKDLSPPPVM